MPGSLTKEGNALVATSKLGGFTILTPARALTFEQCPALEDAFVSAIEDRALGLILDCKRVSLMDSEVLELILKVHEDLEARGGALKLAELNDVCRDIMTVTRLTAILNIHADLGSAIKSGQ